VSTDRQIVVTTYAGLEPVLAKELLALGARNIEEHTRSVSCVGDDGFIYKINYSLRTALRVLIELSCFEIKTGQDLYDGVKKLDWDQYMRLDQTFAVRCTLSSELFDNSLFPALKAKDAIADYFRDKTDSRPDVDKEDPDLDVNVFIHRSTCRILLNTSGDSLHLRGYRVDVDKAPLSEVLAAGIILLSGWQPHQRLIDLMCGSGTIAIEAALIGANIPPGTFRKKYGFEKWPTFDKDLFIQIKESQLAKISESEVRIFANDINKFVVKKAQENIEAAGVEDMITLTVGDFREFERLEGNGCIIINPPYGEKLAVDDITALYKEIGDCFKKKFAGFQAWVFTGSPEGARSIGLRASKKIQLFNGPIECRLLGFDLFEGSKKLKKQPKQEID
jgi:putative N6-adenine-specific DNA methylase